jgi:hypothetical protein
MRVKASRKLVIKPAAISMDQAAMNLNIKLKECLQLFEKLKTGTPELKEKLKIFLHNSEAISAKLVNGGAQASVVGSKLKYRSSVSAFASTDVVENWQEKNGIWGYEGSRGIRNLEKLIKAIGYEDLTEFLMDNSGCIEAMVEWISETAETTEEWKTRLSEEEEEED